MRRLFTVTRQGRPIAVVLAGDFAEAVRLAAPLGLPMVRPANDGPAPQPPPETAFGARRPTDDERRRFAVMASRFRGEVRLAALPL